MEHYTILVSICSFFDRLNEVDKMYQDTQAKNRDKKLEKLYDNAFKMLWEQVLLLAIYARLYMCLENSEMGKSSQWAWQRCRLINVIQMEKKNLKHNSPNNIKQEQKLLVGLEYELLSMIEDVSKSSSDIIKKLQDSQEIDFAKSILRKVEEQGISFPSEHIILNEYKLYYSYYSLYKILFCFDEILEEIIKNIDVDYLPFLEKIDANDPITKAFTPDQTESTKSEPVEDRIYHNLSKLYSNFFDLITNPFHKERFIGYYKEQLLSNVCWNNIFNPNDNIISIKLSRKKYEIIKSMGWGKTLMNQIATKLGILDVIDENISQLTNLQKLSYWFEQHKTGLFIKKEQIPKLIVSILEFDQRIRYNNSNPRSRYTEITKSITEKYGILIYEQRDYSSLTFLRSYEELPKIEFKIVNKKKIYLKSYRNGGNIIREKIVNTLMLDWISQEFDENGNLSENEQKKMMNRFKKLSPYLKVDKVQENFKEIEEMIHKQKTVNTNVPYPDFPFPLWIIRDLDEFFHEHEN